MVLGGGTIILESRFIRVRKDYFFYVAVTVGKKCITNIKRKKIGVKKDESTVCLRIMDVLLVKSLNIT